MYTTSASVQAATCYTNLDYSKSKRHRRDEAFPRLSDRETEVLRSIGLGLSIREIADDLCLSSHTIISHRNSLKQKLHCKKATQLAVMAERLGLLSGLSFHF